MKQTIFCIAGMHRSGSSLFANWLHNSGVFMGNNLYGKESTNPKGHFEDFDFLNIHKKDLSNKGYDVSGLLIDRSEFELCEEEIEAAKKIIKQRQDYSIWGWKEPRTTLYLTSWKKLIPELKVIVLERNKDEVVSSLYKRLKKNKWYYTRNPLKKLAWWLDIDLRPKKWERIFSRTYNLYFEACEAFAKRHQKDILFIKTSDFIQSNKTTAERISLFLNTDKGFVEINTIFEPSLLSTKNVNTK